MFFITRPPGGILNVLKAGIAAVIAGTTMLCSAADPSYPIRPVRVLVGFVPGGGSDLVARVLSRKLGESWGQQFVDDNRAGAGGVVAAETTANAAPDGYTLFVTSSSLTIQPSVIDKLPFDTLRDFTAIGLAASQPFLLVVHPGFEAKTVKQLIDMAKAQPGRINSATAGAGSSVHLAAMLFNRMAGVDMVLVPYKGVAGLTDLISGQVQVAFQGLPVLQPHVNSGRLRALGVTSVSRSPLYPDIPTVAEAAVPRFEVITWYGMIGPARMPRPLIDKLNAGISSAMQSAEVRQSLSSLGLSPEGGTPAAFAARIREEVQKWKQLLTPAERKPG